MHTMWSFEILPRQRHGEAGYGEACHAFSNQLRVCWSKNLACQVVNLREARGKVPAKAPVT